MHTTVLLVRCGETEWAPARKLVGRRDVPLSAGGRTQAERVAQLLQPLDLAEVLSSPLIRAVDTAQIIAQRHRIEVARDPRLTNQHVGAWEAQSFDDLDRDATYRAHQQDPLANAIPGGETLVELRDRVVASVDQALTDNETGSQIVVVTHASNVRVLLAHFLGMDLSKYRRLRVGAGSLSVLRFDSVRERPRVLAINHGDTLQHLLD